MESSNHFDPLNLALLWSKDIDQQCQKLFLVILEQDYMRDHDRREKKVTSSDTVEGRQCVQMAPLSRTLDTPAQQRDIHFQSSGLGIFY